MLLSPAKNKETDGGGRLARGVYEGGVVRCVPGGKRKREGAHPWRIQVAEKTQKVWQEANLEGSKPVKNTVILRGKKALFFGFATAR